MNLINWLPGFVMRLVMMLAGLVFMAGLFSVVLLVLMIWLLSALLATLTGKPVSPWTFQINRKAAWSRFYRASTGGRGPVEADHSDNVVDVDAKDVNIVTDVESKRIK